MNFELKLLISRFLLSLMTGTLTFHFLVNPSLTGRGFIKLLIALYGASLGICFVINLKSGDTAFYLVGLLISIFLYFYHPDRRNVITWMLVIFIQLISFYLLLKDDHTLIQIYLILTTLLLGIVNFQMILGHYYLVVPKLTVAPLLYAHYFLWPLLILKLVITGVFYFSFPAFFELSSSQGEGGMYNLLFLLMRVLWGYLALGILSYFSYKLCRMRSTQSATGVMYVMVFFVLVGELISCYFLFKHGWYL